MKVIKVLSLLKSDVHKVIFFFPILTLYSIKETERSPLNDLQPFLGRGEILGNLFTPWSCPKGPEDTLLL